MSGPVLHPPTGGQPAPETAILRDGASVDLVPLAHEVCRRYIDEFPDEQDRYGDAGQAWCVHDMSYLISWSIDDDQGYLDMTEEVTWLARVLESRHFPLDRLTRGLEIASAVVRVDLPGPSGVGASRVLAKASAYVAARGTFLDPAAVPGPHGR